jgi:hypothetical protein
MGTGTFFSKVASMDPLANALHLPGADKYRQQQASANAGSSAINAGPYQGVAPTLAGANAGYAAGGPGAQAGWRPFTPSAPGGFFNRFASWSAQNTPNPYPNQSAGGDAGTNPTKPAAPGAF